MKRFLFAAIFLFLSLLLFGETKDNDKNKDKSKEKEKTVTTKDILDRYRDTLKYGIVDEVVDVLKDLGKNPKEDFYPLLIQRYKDATLPATKIALADFFSNCENLPDQVVNLLYEDAKKNPENVKLNSTLLTFLGKRGKVREGLLLIDRLKSSNNLIKLTASDSLSYMKDPQIIKPILDRLKLSDESDDMFLDSEIKSKLIFALGKLKAREAGEYLKKILVDQTEDKFVIMYTMTSLAEIQDTSSIDLIAKYLTNDDVKVREYAGYAISLFKDSKVVPILENMLKNNREKIRVFACRGLLLNNDLAAVKILTYKFQNDPSELVRKEATETLIGFGGPGINAIKDAMKDSKYSSLIVYNISQAVAQKPSVESVNFLLSIYDKADKDNRDIMAKNIVTGDSNLLDPAISKLLDSTDYLIRLGALKAVYGIKNTTLWPRVKTMSEKDGSDAVKNYAKKILALKGL